MRYLLDTNVVSALRLRGRNPAVAAWARSIPIEQQFVASLTIAEIERGVIAKERSDPPQGAVLRRWFGNNVLPAFTDRVLPFDLPAARILASYRGPEHAPWDDALIAAIAQAGQLTVVTRNTRHFEPLGVPFLNPWETLATPEPGVSRLNGEPESQGLTDALHLVGHGRHQGFQHDVRAARPWWMQGSGANNDQLRAPDRQAHQFPAYLHCHVMS